MKKQGFSLLELAIVITIIGLLASSVIAGQKALRQSNIKALVKDIEQYQNALQTFKIAYEKIPGDMNNATDYWSSATNGNGNGYTEWSTDGTRMFLHLSLAKITADNLTAYDSGSEPATIVGTHIPETSMDRVGISGYACTASFCGNTGFLPQGNYYMVGEGKSANYNSGGAYNGLEAFTIDTKIDDGLPGTGIMRTTLTSCVAGEGSAPWDASNVTYDKSNTSNDCFAWIRFITEY